MDEIKHELKKLLETLEDTETCYDLEKFGSVLRKIHEANSKVRKMIERIENK